LAVAAVAGVLGSVVAAKLRNARDRAWEQVSFAMSNLAQGNRDEALKTIDALLAAQKSGPVAVQGLLMKTDILSAQGKKADAAAVAREALRQADSPEYKAIAQARVAWALEEAGKPADAAQEYDKFLKTYPDHFLAGRAYAQLGRLQLLLGRPAEAKVTLEKLVTLYPSTVWARDAKDALEELKKLAPLK
jgi:TolA-binding protein